MIDRNPNNIPYNREIFSMAEEMYEGYIKMRKAVYKYEKNKYKVDDEYLQNEDFKQGFIAGVKSMSSIFQDM